MEPGSSKKSEDDIPKNGKSTTTTATTSPDPPQPKKSNWLITWLKTQVKAFSLGLLIMAIKYVSAACA
jgi:hypothetical protein